MTRDDPRREIRDLWRAVAKARQARGDLAGAAQARASAKIAGSGVQQLGRYGRAQTGYLIRSAESGRWRRRA